MNFSKPKDVCNKDGVLRTTLVVAYHIYKKLNCTVVYRRTCRGGAMNGDFLHSTVTVQRPLLAVWQVNNINKVIADFSNPPTICCLHKLNNMFMYFVFLVFNADSISRL
jgi:hypothetical protein